MIAVRVFDHFGSGGFPGAAAQMTVGRDKGEGPTLPLAGPWAYKIERRLKPIVADWSERPKMPGARRSQQPVGASGTP